MSKCFDLGAIDYITRPFEPVIVQKRVKNAYLIYEKKKTLYDNLLAQIEDKQKQTAILLAILAKVLQFRNNESKEHLDHIGIITYIVLNKLRLITDKYNLTEEDVSNIAVASSLHDIGKIGVPEDILNKPGRLSKEEFEQIKMHTIIGAVILDDFKKEGEGSEIVRYAYDICKWHHERIDGNGYPDKLRGNKIPIWCQVVGIADCYDALMQKRCYKESYTSDEALKMIANDECGVFDELLVRCLYESKDEIEDTLKNTTLLELLRTNYINYNLIF